MEARIRIGISPLNQMAKGMIAIASSGSNPPVAE